MDKIKLCWRWPGTSREKTEWLQAWSPEFSEDFELFCEAAELAALEEAGFCASSGGFDWGEGSQTALLAFLASGEARAAVWIDESEGCANLSPYALRLCRARGTAMAMDPAAAALMLAGFQRLGKDAP